MHRESKDILKSSNLRCTRQREVVYETLASTRAHPTAEELFGMVRASEPGLSLATVYNTLEAFVRTGLCRRIPCPSGATRYDADMREHVHLTTAEGRVLDVPEDLGSRLVATLSGDLRTEIERRLGVSMSKVALHLVAQSPVEGDAPAGAAESAADPDSGLSSCKV